MQVAGTWSDDAAEKITGALVRLGLEKGYTVHAADGLGELTITGPSTAFAIRNGTIEKLTFHPEDFGFAPQPFDAIRGGDAQFNKAIAESILHGEPGAPREIVLMNAALALFTAGKGSSLKESVGIAEESIDSGAAGIKLRQLRDLVSSD
jgi:anthranilate phosphoribosyltransferase